MSTRNKHNHNNFDLDQYLEEKANSEESTKQVVEESPKKSGFFRNALVLLVAIVGTVLWYYDWNPRAAYSGLFGADTNQPVLAEGINNVQNATPPPVPIAPNNTRIADLERSAEALANSEELERLTEQSVALAMESAFKALESLENMDFSNLESLEKLEGLEDLGKIAERAALEALNNIDLSEIKLDAGASDVASFDQFSQELSANSIDQFTTGELQEMHKAGIPSSFLIQLNDVGLLVRLDASEIISLFEEE